MKNQPATEKPLPSGKEYPEQSSSELVRQHKRMAMGQPIQGGSPATKEKKGK